MHFRDSPEKLPLALIFSWHLWHFTIPVDLLSIHSFLFRLFFLLVPSIHKTTFIAYVNSTLLPWFPPFFSGYSYTVSNSSWLLLDICEYLLRPCLPLNYSFSGFILGGHFCFLWLQFCKELLNPHFQPCHLFQVEELSNYF